MLFGLVLILVLVVVLVIVAVVVVIAVGVSVADAAVVGIAAGVCFLYPVGMEAVVPILTTNGTNETRKAQLITVVQLPTTQQQKVWQTMTYHSSKKKRNCTKSESSEPPLEPWLMALTYSPSLSQSKP